MRGLRKYLLVLVIEVVKKQIGGMSDGRERG
jgi:hypothetical protein